MTHPAKRQIGILGGTFDPPHLGHLAMATTAHSALSLDEMIFMVANDPWQKSGDRDVTPATIRLEMARALVTHHKEFIVDDREIRRGGVTYTLDTLLELQREYLDAEFFLIVGADTASRFHTWHRYLEVLALSTLVIVNRTNATPTLAPEVAAANVVHLSMTPIDVSSTQIRNSVATGQSVDAFTSLEVRDVISSHHLYESVSL